MKKLSIVLENTLTGKPEVVQENSKPLTMYVCGITPYDFAHMGHGRCYVTFDVLVRLLRFLGYSVKYCRNVTDIDDKLLHKAEKAFGSRLRYKEVADQFTAAFHEDMAALGCVRPDHEPRVTESIAEIIEFIQGLLDKKKAYVAGGDVYFSVSSFPGYGKLSKRNLDDLLVGARVEVNPLKRDPLDFVLWKGDEPESFWKSPWGWGRPGWHIECSAMARSFFGDSVDIHGGGMDLIFPHHENEIAQSEALTGTPFVRTWVHNAFVTLNKEKMSKSLGNFFTLRTIFEKYPARVVRWYFLQHQYRAPLDFSWEDFEMVEKGYSRCAKIFADHRCENCPVVDVQKSSIVQRMLTFLVDDLNTPGLMGVLFENFKTLREDAVQACAVKSFFGVVLGVEFTPLPEKQVAMTPEIERLVAEREIARRERNFKRADELREQLRQLGFEVHDTKTKKA